MSSAPKTTAVFNEFIALLTEIRDGYVLNPERFTNAVDIAEAYRYVGQAISAASEMFFEADPEHPHFIGIVSPERKMQGDNPDAIYHFSRVRGDLAYRVSGTIEQECYTSFTVHGRAEDGGMAGPLLGDVNDSDLQVAEDGSYEVVFSATETDGNWVELHPDAHSIIVRSYYQLPTSAQNDPNVNVRIDIRTIDAVPPPPPLNDDIFSERMAEGVAFLRQVTVGQNLPGAPSAVPFVSDEVNHLPVPFSFRDSGLPVPGAADIFYSMGRWDLAADEALVITGTIPPGPFANVMLWNAHMQTLEYRDRQSSLNAAQVQLEDDGTYRIVIADSDPGVPNWLDTCGHARGTIFWRFLLPETDPVQPICEVVPLSSLRP